MINLAGNIKINFLDIESYIKSVADQYEVLSDMQYHMASVAAEISEVWEDPSCDRFQTAFENMREETIPQALVLLDTMQTLLETVCTTYRETDQSISAMIG